MKNYLPIILGLLLWGGCSQGLFAQTMEGMASFYGDEFDGKSTSTGETFRQEGYMAASKELPWGTIVEVTNISNGKKVQVRVNDCGPHAKNRIIDLSKRAARELDFIKQGEAMVRLRIVRASNSGPNCSRGAWAKGLRKAGKPIPPPPGPWKPEDTAGAAGQVTPPSPTVVPGQAAPAVAEVPAGSVQGMASYYADRFNGRPTSTGEIYDAKDFTAASKAYPYNTLLEVTNAASGERVTVRVNDCGPHNPERILDLSKAAATQIGVTRAGAASVYVRVIRLGTDGPTCNRADWSAKAPETTAAAPEAYEPPARQPAALSAYNFPEAYYVQLGAFSSPASAEMLTRRAVARGYVNAHYNYDPQSGLYTTTIRRFYDQASGEKVQKQLAKDGFGKTALKKARTPGELTTDASGKVSAAGVAPDELTVSNAYLVQLGSFASVSSAEGLARDARAAGYVDPHVYFNPETKLHTAILYTYYDEPTAKMVQAQLRSDGFVTTSLAEEFTLGSVASEPISKPAAAATPTLAGNVTAPGSVAAYTLQIGAFKDENAAYMLADELAAAGYVDGGVYTNPNTGLYSTVLWTVYNRVTAKKVQGQLKEDGFGASLKETKELPQNIKTAPESKGETALAPATYNTPAAAPKTYDADAILFGVQVGSFSTAAGAKEAKKQLAAAGITEVYDAKVGKMTRVFAGKFYFPNQAEELKDQLREAGFPGAAVRRVQ